MWGSKHRIVYDRKTRTFWVVLSSPVESSTDSHVAGRWWKKGEGGSTLLRCSIFQISKTLRHMRLKSGDVCKMIKKLRGSKAKMFDNSFVHLASTTLHYLPLPSTPVLIYHLIWHSPSNDFGRRKIVKKRGERVKKKIPIYSLRSDEAMILIMTVVFWILNMNTCDTGPSIEGQILIWQRFVKSIWPFFFTQIRIYKILQEEGESHGEPIFWAGWIKKSLLITNWYE